MRLCSYNILDGGEGRADPLAEVLIAQRPDVVVIVEADVESVIDRLMQRLNMDGIVGVGSGSSVAILSRWPIASSINHNHREPEAGRALLKARIETPRGELPIFALHLSPHATLADDRKRVAELERILAIAEPYRKAGERHLLVGDFNADTPTQQIDIGGAHPRTREPFEANGGRLPTGAVQTLLHAGYLDAHHTFDAAFADRSATFTTLYPQQRVDYCFLHGFAPTEIVDAWVEHDRLATYASDHYPIGVELTF